MSVLLFRKRWFIVSIAVVALLLATLVGTPFLIRHLAKSWLLENGGDQVQFQDVDFNPFTARLVLKALDVKVDDETTLSFDTAGLDLAWRPLFNKQINVQSVQLNGLHLVIDNRDALKIGGIALPPPADAPPPEAPEASDWLSGLESLAFTDIRIEYRDNKVRADVDFDRVQLSGLAQWAPEQPARLDASGAVNGAKLALNADLAPLAAQPEYRGHLSLEALALDALAPLAGPALEALGGKLSVQSDFRLTQAPDGLQLAHEGKVLIEALQLATAAAKIDSGSTQLEGATEVRLNDGAVSVTNRGTLTVAKLALLSDAADLDNPSLAWDGSTEVRLGGPDGAMMVSAEGRLAIGPVEAALKPQDMQVTGKRFALQGKAGFTQTAEQPSIQLASDIELEQVTISKRQDAAALLDLQSLAIDGLRVEGPDSIHANSIAATMLTLGPGADTGPDGPAALLQIAATSISQAAFADKVISADSVQQDGVQLRIHRDNAGRLTLTNWIDSLTAPGAEAPAQAPPAPAEAAPEAGGATTPAFAIKRVQLGGDSVISILDESVEPVFSTELRLQEVSLENLDSRQADQGSTLRVEGSIGKHTRLALNGEVQPFRKPPGLDLKGEVRALDLPPLSSYTRDSLGVLLNSGTLDSEISVKTGSDQALDGLGKLELHQLELTGTAAKDNLQSHLPVPLDVALDTLRDKRNRIELEIPVQGRIDDPKFNFNDAINQALAKGLQKGAFSYLKHALQPYGTLISVAQFAGEQINKVRLNPVEFAPGAVELDAAGREYLQKVAGVLKERPKIAIKLCGVAVQQDRLALQQQLQAQQPPQKAAPADAAAPAPAQAVAVDDTRLGELAQQRADAVKDHLVEQHGVPASHLVGCLPQVDAGETAIPRTDLLI